MDAHFDSKWKLKYGVSSFFTALSLALMVFCVQRPAAAATSSCEQTFATPQVEGPPNQSRITQRRNEGIAQLARRLRAPKFDLTKFDEALALYRREPLKNARRPETREERLAFFHAVLSSTGRNPYDLELWARQASPVDLKRLAKSMGGVDLDRGFSPSRIDALVWKLFQFSESNPATLTNLRRAGAASIDRIAIEQWTTKELASASALEAFERLGLIRDTRLREKWLGVIRRHPGVQNLITDGAMMVFETVALGSPISLPRWSKLHSTKLDQELREKVEREGFDATYPLLKARYGHLATFDRRFFFARRTATVGLMTFILIHLYPALMREIVPAELQTSGESAVQLTTACVKYYGSLLIATTGDLTANDSAENENASDRANKSHREAVDPVTSLDQTQTSPNRTPLTFDQQIGETPHPMPQTDQAVTGSPSTPPNSQDVTTSVEENLKYLKNLDFSNPTNR